MKDDETFHHSTNLSLALAIANQEQRGWTELADFIVILRIDCDELKFSTMQSFHLSRELNDDFELFLRSIELYTLFKASNIIMMNRSCSGVE